MPANLEPIVSVFVQVSSGRISFLHIPVCSQVKQLFFFHCWVQNFNLHSGCVVHVYSESVWACGWYCVALWQQWGDLSCHGMMCFFYLWGTWTPTLTIVLNCYFCILLAPFLILKLYCLTFSNLFRIINRPLVLCSFHIYIFEGC